MTEPELREAIRAWVSEYGQGGLPRASSTNFLQSLIDHKGFVPSSGYRAIPMGTVADEVEEAVRAMASTPAMPGRPNVCFRAAMVFRAYYLLPKYWPETERLKWLSEIGMPVSRRSYFYLLKLAKHFIMGYIPTREINTTREVAPLPLNTHKAASS